MLLKLALRNMRRSIKDYTIYFVTLIIAVVIFYAFNSITDQHIMQEINESSYTNILEVMDLMMGMFSLVVALVLGFLIIYANQILVRRRKMEFGIYFTLGMKPGQVSRMLLYETVLVGLISLVLGLLLGIIVSQLLSFATAALFGVSMPQYQFDFSPDAFVATLLAFLVIYVIVSVFNVIIIHRCKLIDLINASKSSQKVAIRNPWLCLALFIVSIGILAAAYWKLVDTGFLMITPTNTDLGIATGLMLVGTLLLFFSLSGFLAAIITKNKRLYFKKLRPFTFRQVVSKINTSFASMWIVCVLLFLAITTFSTGMNLVTMFTGDVNDANPFDISVLMVESNSSSSKAKHVSTDDDGRSVLEKLEDRVKDWDDYVADAAQLNIRDLPDIKYSQYTKNGGVDIADYVSNSAFEDGGVEVIAVSELNHVLEMVGEEPVQITDGEYMIMNNMSALEEAAELLVKNNAALKVPGGELRPIDRVLKLQLYDYDILSVSLIMAVPDHVVDNLPKDGSLSYITAVDISLFDKDDAAEFQQAIYDADIDNVTNVLTREQMIEQAMGLRVMLTYLAVYIGLVLLIATAAVLAIQLMSLTIDSLGRYRMLVKLGCESSMIKGSLFAQVLIFFMAPLVPALCHSACAISVLNGELSQIMRMGIEATVICVVALLIIYGGYMIVTYLASRSMMQEAWKRP